MQIDRRITNGLAWAGVFVVIAVPVADAVSGQLMGGGDRIAVASVDSVSEIVAPVPAPLSQRPPAIEPAANTAVAIPAKPVAVAAAKPVAASAPIDSFLASGKKLPSYITGGDDDAPAQAAVAPAAAPTVAKPVATAPIETAAVPSRPAILIAPATPTNAVAIDPIEVATVMPAVVPGKIAPVPMPLSMRPRPVTQPLVGQLPPEEIVLPPAMVAGANRQPVVVDDLQDWESGPLSDFLARREAQQQQSSATVTRDDEVYYRNRPNRRPPRDIYLGPVEDDEVFFPFGN